MPNQPYCAFYFRESGSVVPVVSVGRTMEEALRVIDLAGLTLESRIPYDAIGGMGSRLTPADRRA